MNGTLVHLAARSSGTLNSIMVKHNGGGQDKPVLMVPRPFVLEEMKPEPLSFLIVRETSIPEPFIGDGLLYPGTTMVIGGASKARKSWLAIDLALSLVSGEKFLTHDVPMKKLRVLYLGAEGMEWKLRRDFMQAVAFKPGVTDDDLDRLWVLATLGRIKIDTDAGENWLDENAGMFQIVIIDPYYRFLSTGSENKHEDQRVIQDVLDRLKAQGKAIVLCHHLRKSQGEDAGAAELRGAGLDAFADSILILKRKRTAHSDRTELHYTLRNAPEPDPLDLAITEATGPLLQVAEPVERIVTGQDVVDVIVDADGRVDGRQAIVEALKRSTGASEASTRRAISGAETKGIIASAKRTRPGQGRTYFLPEKRNE